MGRQLEEFKIKPRNAQQLHNKRRVAILTEKKKLPLECNTKQKRNSTDLNNPFISSFFIEIGKNDFVFQRNSRGNKKNNRLRQILNTIYHMNTGRTRKSFRIF